jgi:hypothetical protein
MVSPSPAAALASAVPGPRVSADPAALVRRVAAHPTLVARIDVAHLDDDRTTRTTVDAAALDRLATALPPVTNRARIDALCAALRAASVQPAERSGDLRWHLVLRDARGAPLLDVYCDRFGRHGLVDRTPVSMEGDVLVSLLRER